MAAAVEIEDLSKSFKLYREKFTSLKERMVHLGRVPFEEFKALDHINLTIEAGETVGLLGHNGSGKSTLLKCIAGLLKPTSGVVRTHGRLAALLELGAGFQPDLSGRENVFLNGSILGLKQAEIRRRFDEIVGFAGLEQFIDTPVKHYSSGMVIRLGFAVAINVDPEILLVDEVLAVGDEAFQRKCIDKVKTFQQEGRTIVVVTHAADLVRQLCDKAAALDHGKLVIAGDPNEVIREFRERLMQGVTEATEVGAEVALSELNPFYNKVRISDVHVAYPDDSDDRVTAGHRLDIAVDLTAAEPQDDVIVSLNIYGPMGVLVHSTNTELMGLELGQIDTARTVTFRMDQVPLLDGTYPITIGVHTSGGLMYDIWEQQRSFEVANPGRELGLVALPIKVE
ncbi:MAG: ABC transporter ATP-binding protein [Acidimicrobiales bacterium]